jgi:hypothetical protein
MSRSTKFSVVSLKGVLASFFHQEWFYLETLNVNPGELHEASYEQILSNPGDVAIGVNRVQVLLDRVFFGLFDCLVIKHFITGEINLMFNTNTADAEQVIGIFNEIVEVLGNGWTFEPRFSNFRETDKIRSLAQGKYSGLSDEIVQVWNLKNFSITLNYKLDPLNQLLLSINRQVKKMPDQNVRVNGTLLNLLSIAPVDLLNSPEIKQEIHEENGRIKFKDYTFQLSKRELNLFDRARLRIFGSEKKLHTNIQMHLSYFSDFEMNSSEVISLSNKISDIYGSDNSGMRELEPHEIDMIEADQMWTGRSWTFSRSHKIYDFNDATQSILYQVSISSTPDRDGITLKIIGYDQMLDFQQLLSDAN